jgi:hypothetical protein
VSVASSTIQVVARYVLNDTDPEVFRRQVACWRAMSAGELALLADRMSVQIAEIAVAGIRHVMPDASPHEVRHELARRRYGRRLADAAYALSPHES